MLERHIIANMALGRLGANRISSFEQGTAEADLVRDHYEQCVRECLEDGSWNFAEAAVRLAKDAEAARPDFAYSYALPIDCIAPKWLMDETGCISRYRYRISKTRLCTDLDGAWLVYTWRAPEALFGSLFTGALQHLLASRIAPALTETEAKTEQEYRLYLDLLPRARSRNGQQDQPERFDTSVFISEHVG